MGKKLLSVQINISKEPCCTTEAATAGRQAACAAIRTRCGHQARCALSRARKNIKVSLAEIPTLTLTLTAAAPQARTQRGHGAQVVVLEGDRGHARRARARLLVQLLGQVPPLLLRHLRARPET